MLKTFRPHGSAATRANSGCCALQPGGAAAAGRYAGVEPVAHANEVSGRPRGPGTRGVEPAQGRTGAALPADVAQPGGSKNCASAWCWSNAGGRRAPAGRLARAHVGQLREITEARGAVTVVALRSLPVTPVVDPGAQGTSARGAPRAALRPGCTATPSSCTWKVATPTSRAMSRAWSSRPACCAGTPLNSTRRATRRWPPGWKSLP